MPQIPENVKTFPMRLDSDLYRNLAQFALDNNKSRSAVIREALVAYLTIPDEVPEETTKPKTKRKVRNGKSKSESSTQIESQDG